MVKYLTLMKASKRDDHITMCLERNLEMYMKSHPVMILKHICDLYIDHSIVLTMAILKAYCLDTHWNMLMVKCLALMTTINCYYLLVKCLALYLETYMESRLGLIFEQSWDL